MISSSQVQQMIEECRANGRGYRDGQDTRISLEKLAWKDAATALRRVRDCVKRAETHRASYMPNARPHAEAVADSVRADVGLSGGDA